MRYLSVMRQKLRIPTVLAVAFLGCGGGKSPGDAPIVGDGACQVLCIPDGTDAGVCPDPFVCVSAANHTCPGGCMCTAFCFPRTPEGEQNCPTDQGVQCASPERTCPAGCEAVA
jgi:hypothetical protein